MLINKTTNMNIEFGIPKIQKAPKTGEKHPSLPVLTIEPAPLASKGRYKFSLNPMAIELLGITSDLSIVNFGFVDGKVFIGTPSEGISVSKAGSFSNAEMHKLITDILILDATVQNERMLVTAPDVSNAFLLSEIITSEVITSESIGAVEDQRSELFEEVTSDTIPESPGFNTEEIPA